MLTSLPELQGLLLDMLSTHRRVDAVVIERLNKQEWDLLMEMVRQHRLAPLLHWRLTNERADLPVPESIRDNLAATFKSSTIRALTLQRELVLTHRILDKAGVPHIALKGAYLAFHVYPHPAIRPLRDLDILVPKERALEAFQVLIDGGLTRPKQYQGDPSAAIEQDKHLPPLFSPSGNVFVELHNLLFSKRISGGRSSDLADDPHLWQRTISQSVVDESLTYMSHADLLLHLIVHAVYDHKFNNGPLTLYDLACLLERESIDWQLFWQLAEKLQVVQGCTLCLKMTERYYGKLPIRWSQAEQPDHKSLDKIIETASLLTLRDFNSRGNANLGLEIQGKKSALGKIGVFLRKPFPPKKLIEARYPVSEYYFSVYFWYIPWWWRLLTKRLPAYLADRGLTREVNEVDDLTRLENWLIDLPD